jgi:hypothetical protein
MHRIVPVFVVAASCIAVAVALPLAMHQPTVMAQSKSSKSKAADKKKKKNVNTNQIDVHAEKLQVEFIREAGKLANEYFDAGAYEKARSLLESIIALDPSQKDIEDKLKIIDEKILSSNDFSVEVNSANTGWEPANALVYENRPIRLMVEGTYKLSLSGTVGPLGIPSRELPKEANDSVSNEVVPGFPCGSLIGVIVGADKKLGKPFLVGEGGEFTPKETGMLLLRINSPTENKNNGKLKVQISGYVRSAQ